MSMDIQTDIALQQFLKDSCNNSSRSLAKPIPESLVAEALSAEVDKILFA
jgi:hypothetical protein